MQIFYYYFYGDFLFYIGATAVLIWRVAEHISATPPPIPTLHHRQLPPSSFQHIATAPVGRS